MTNILQNLTDFLKWNSKWSEVPYAQAFWALRSRPSLCKACSNHEVLLCTLPPKQKGSSSSTNHRPQPSTPTFHTPGIRPRTSPLPTHYPANPLLPLHPTHLLARKPLLTPPPPATPSPRLPLPSSLPNCHTVGIQLVTYPTHVPLREMAGPEGPTRVHVPFSCQI